MCCQKNDRKTTENQENDRKTTENQENDRKTTEKRQKTTEKQQKSRKTTEKQENDRKRQNGLDLLLVRMKLDVKIEVLKFCFTVLNSVFLVLGLSVMGCGIWILFDSGSFLNVLSSEELKVVAAGLFIIGGVVALVSLTGCTGAALEKRFLLLVYLCFLIALVLGQLYVTVLLLLYRNRIDGSLAQTVNNIISQYGNGSSRADRIMDNIQHFTNCCGVNGPDDWLKNSFIQTLNLTGRNVLPCSCFRSFQPSINSSWCLENESTNETVFGTGTGTFNESCKQTINQWLQENVITIVAMAAFLVLIQIVDIFIAGSLFRMFGEKDTLKKNKRLVGEDDTDSHSASEPDPDGGEQNHAFIDPDEGAAEPNYMTAGDTNHMADQYNQNQEYQEPFHYNQNQNQGYQEPFHYNQNQNQNQGYMPAGDANNMTFDQYNYNQDQNQGFQEPLNFSQNQDYHGYQEATQHY
ncbi:CD82 antigen [Gambusia affinis]|uniref:CD82 antigen n=1 Tax=Gambusia affinis TaxID=33528 RepID=UPI001CDD24E5|nr:CD82 antigen [Gambusia affinis]XP_043971736.1 CD82 antigen [Gambusia affinis]